MKAQHGLPLVYSCSGASGAAQTANQVALRLDRLGAAEMSCVAGLGGDVGALIAVASSGRRIIALDGCALQCVAKTLERHALAPQQHHVLSALGVKKRKRQDPLPEDVDRVVAHVLSMQQAAADLESAATG